MLGQVMLAVIFILMTAAMMGVIVMAFPEWSFGGPAIVAVVGIGIASAAVGMVGVIVMVVALGAAISLITGGLGGGE